MTTHWLALAEEFADAADRESAAGNDGAALVLGIAASELLSKARASLPRARGAWSEG